MFRKDFKWGLSAAAYPVEGASMEDGKGKSIWDVFCERPGAIARGEKADVSCDHYHHWEEDIDLMAKIGANAFRTSLSWPRILPEGKGQVNQKGLDFYDRLIDRCLEKGIEPYLTLYHWDLPQALAEKGGWMNRDCTDWFAEYAELVGRHFSDRVTQFMPLNEPTCALVLGYSIGVHAPGLKLGTSECAKVGLHMLLAHGKAVSALRGVSSRPLSIGIATVANIRTPMTSSPEDIEAAKQATFSPDKGFENAAWWLDPIHLGNFDQQKRPGYEGFFEGMRPGDAELISQPIEYLAVNTYNSYPAMAVSAGAGTGGSWCPGAFPPGYPKTSMGWPVTPEVLYYGPKFFAERYHLPVLISENGVALQDWVSLDGKVHDPNRTDYIRRYLRELWKAADEVDILGYFYYSLLDNFEWSDGFDKRFGLVYVDYESKKRTLKDSAEDFAEIIRQNGENLF